MQNLAEVQWLIDRTKIIETIVRFANALDRKDWQKLRDLLTEEVAIDYSEFRGEAPKRIAAAEYVQQRSKSLAHLRTLHISTNHAVKIQGSSAECDSAYYIFRLDPTREINAQRLDTAGNYYHQFVQIDERWLICGIRQTVTVSEGDRSIHPALQGQALQGQ
ncbi:nuclear transport factor 2 family protein [Microcoleus sp. FACHB-1515]|uniref:nuclear transport factor 2 family protein n=1 Tax=Cyanophyceae TaxID=3028117 RepID=UPI0016867953|nr:nuclear transport factor 2 family protein [Microcoleus sp. FACHB-1515]MBD2091683.1 nuclear transport factor 2 family protein [Microcoleus sp. FACHB-1515]